MDKRRLNDIIAGIVIGALFTLAIWIYATA